jgi:hypothetical protein
VLVSTVADANVEIDRTRLPEGDRAGEGVQESGDGIVR